MKNMNNSQKTITSALEELGAELGISEADFGGKVKSEHWPTRHDKLIRRNKRRYQ
jgi:hypothetical protein